MIDKNWKFLWKLFEGYHKHSEYFKSLQFKGNDILQLEKEEDCAGIYVITNALFKRKTDCFIFDLNNYFEIINNKNIYYLDTKDFEIYVKQSKWKKYEYNFYDKTNSKFLFKITCNDNLDVYLTNNFTSLDILINKNGMPEIIDKTIKEKDNVIASIFSDIMGKNYKHGIARIIFYKEVDDYIWEICILIAMCTYMIYNNKLLAIHNHYIAMMGMSLNFRRK